MIAKVAPVRRMPKAISELDYLVPETMTETIQIGHLVLIPFRNQNIYGVVTNLQGATKVEKKIKAVTELVWPIPAFTWEQLNFLREISEFYNTPLGFILQTALLPLKKTKIKKLVPEFIQTEKKLARTKPELQIYSNQEEKNKIFNEAIGEGQTLIIVPEISSIKSIVENLKNNLSAQKDKKDTQSTKEILIVHSELGEKDSFDLWVKIRSNKNIIVVGTRAALFMPWSDLRTVIVDDESNPNHKSWDMAPRIHAREAALMLSHAHGARCILSGHSPSVESWYFAKAGVYLNTIAPQALHQEETLLIDMRDERRGKNYSAISTELDDSLTRPGDIFLFINRKGSSSYVGCRDCGYISKCPNCKRGLVYHENTATLECHFCHTKVKIFLNCPQCGGTNVAMYGVGTQLLENELKKKNLTNKTIVRLDSDTAGLEKEKITGDKIFVGTQLAWNKIDWSKISLMCFLDADASLFVPEYKMSENLWWQIRDAQYRLPEKSTLLIQTGHTEHQVFSNLTQVAKFYETESLERKLFSYPPFGYILRLYNGDKTAELSLRAANDLVRHLRALTKDQKNTIISDPLAFSPAYFKGLYYCGIIVKIGFEKYKQTTKFIAQNIPEDWKFDPNPSNLLSF